MPSICDVAYKFACPKCRKVNTVETKLFSTNVTSNMSMEEAKRNSRARTPADIKCKFCKSPLPKGIDVSVTIGTIESGTLQSLRDRNLLP
jgi:hypothetical protein